MKIHLEILDDNGEILAEHFADASTPSAWTASPAQKFVSKMPQNSDNINTGTYELFRITVQPVVRVQRPNGYTESPPSPLTGFKQAVPWGQSSLTPAISFQNQNSQAKPPALSRG